MALQGKVALVTGVDSEVGAGSTFTFSVPLSQ